MDNVLSFSLLFFERNIESISHRLRSTHVTHTVSPMQEAQKKALAPSVLSNLNQDVRCPRSRASRCRFPRIDVGLSIA